MSCFPDTRVQFGAPITLVVSVGFTSTLYWWSVWCYLISLVPVILSLQQYSGWCSPYTGGRYGAALTLVVSVMSALTFVVTV